MTRRSFFAIALTPLALSFKLPARCFVSEFPPSFSAISYLTQRWNWHCKGRGAASMPHEIEVSPALFHHFENEIVIWRRFVPYELIEPSQGPSLVFKMATLRPSPKLSSLQYRFYDHRGLMGGGGNVVDDWWRRA